MINFLSLIFTFFASFAILACPGIFIDDDTTVLMLQDAQEIVASRYQNYIFKYSSCSCYSHDGYSVSIYSKNNIYIKKFQLGSDEYQGNRLIIHADEVGASETSIGLIIK